MPDTESSAPDPLDQLFAASDEAPVISTAHASKLETDEEAADRSAAELQSRAARYQRSEDLLSRLTPRVWVTPSLLIANVGYFILMTLQGVDPLLPDIVDLLKWGANYAPLTWGGQSWRLLTCIFMHSGLIHLGVNMWALWSAGRVLERLVGNVGFLIIYFSAGIAGSLASLWWNGDVVSVGASGAVFGLLGAFASFIWNRSDTFPMSALARLKSSLVWCIGVNLLLGASIPGIDQAAHIGGLVSGLILGCVLSQRLDQHTPQRRFQRNMIAACIAVASVGLAILTHPPAPPDLLFKELAVYEDLEPATLKKFDEAATAFNKKSLSSKQMIDVIEKEILPDWRRIEEHLDSLKNVPRGRRELLHQLRTHLTLREEAWLLLIEALKKNSPVKYAEYKAKWTQAEQVRTQLPGVSGGS